MGAGWMIAMCLLLISVKAQLLLLTIEVTDIVSNWISFLEQEFFFKIVCMKVRKFHHNLKGCSDYVRVICILMLFSFIRQY